jgi:ketosteroid isomerase-like protein
MEKQALNTVTEFVNAVKAVNLEKIGAILHPAVQWEQPGNNRFSGSKTSRDEVFQMVGGMFEVSGNTLRLENIKTIAVNGNEVSVVLHWKANRTGAELDTENVDVYTVKDGQITGVKVYAADLPQENLFWGN